jgi:hypothetical protein
MAQDRTPHAAKPRPFAWARSPEKSPSPFLSLPGLTRQSSPALGANAVLDHRVKPGDDERGGAGRPSSDRRRLLCMGSFPRKNVAAPFVPFFVPSSCHRGLLCMGSFRPAGFHSRFMGSFRRIHQFVVPGGARSADPGPTVPCARNDGCRIAAPGGVRHDEKEGATRRPFHGLVSPKKGKRTHHRGTEAQRTNPVRHQDRQCTENQECGSPSRAQRATSPSSCLLRVLEPWWFALLVPLCLCVSVVKVRPIWRPLSVPCPPSSVRGKEDA